MAPRKTTTATETSDTVETAAAEETATPRVFVLRSDATVGDGDAAEPVHRVSFGCNPRVSLGPGVRFETTDQSLADALAADPLLEETTL